MSFILYTIFEVLKGVPNTLIITIVAIIFGLIIGTLFAIIRLKNVPVLSQLIIIYNSFFQKYTFNRTIIYCLLWVTFTNFIA
ncbi:amino acid ABC transporter permease [Staphylococcus gallinarum]|uniref:Amino acid ABC transporter permease n=1 Tax=Staphylococcus gallinarum TaxID=1293 RepID=A0A380FLA6_STAGA|nr:amino acid ABC transporter permease [Staphylococcus gallinarum]